ncbi:hypothetical protein FRC08_002313 [Ceratobasidium sp. 394]|nr:hypothetical protein FRC08_002313 [Ceratobasidium sp. 394]
MSLLEQARHRREQLQQEHRPLPPRHPPLPSIHTLAPLPAPVARPAAFAVAHRTQDGKQAYDYGDLHETASGGGYSYYSSSQTPAPRDPMFRYVLSCVPTLISHRAGRVPRSLSPSFPPSLTLHLGLTHLHPANLFTRPRHMCPPRIPTRIICTRSPRATSPRAHSSSTTCYGCTPAPALALPAANLVSARVRTSTPKMPV